MEVPKWAQDFLANSMSRLGLQQWRLRVRMKEFTGNEAGMKGQTHLDLRYNEADMYLNEDDFSRTPDAYLTMTHEVVHIACAPMELCMKRILELVPQDLQTHATKLWEDGNEQSVEAMAKALFPVMMYWFDVSPTEVEPYDEGKHIVVPIPPMSQLPVRSAPDT